MGGCKFPCLVYREINSMWCGCFFLEWSREWVGASVVQNSVSGQCACVCPRIITDGHKRTD